MRSSPIDDERLTPPRQRLVLAMLVTAGLIGLGGCTSTLASLPGIGEPAGLPERPVTPAAYPAVHDMPTPRETKPLTESERKELEAQLTQVRDRQMTGIRPAAKKAATPK